jgi:prevent-host-death family protein
MVIDHDNFTIVVEKVAISVFKARCLSMLERVRRTGTPLLITKRGEPIAEIVAPSSAHSREDWIGAAAGTGTITGDVVEPLGADDWEAARE